MQYQALYEKLQGLRVLNLLDEENNIELLNEEFKSEFFHIDNITSDLFIELEEDEQKAMIEVLTFFTEELTSLTTEELFDELVGTIYISDDEEFTPNLEEWEEASIMAKPHYNEVNNLNAIKLWNHENPAEVKNVYERMDGIPIEVVYKKGQFEKAIVAGKDVTKNAVYFNGMVKELDDPMDCIVTGVTTISTEDMPTIKSIIELEHIEVEPTAEAITSQLKGRNEELLEHITFIADNVHIIKFHHTGENVV